MCTRNRLSSTIYSNSKFPRHYSIQIEKSRTNMNKILQKHNSLNFNNLQYKSELKKVSDIDTSKEKETYELTEKLLKIRSNLSNLESSIKNELENNDNNYYEQRRIAHFCNDIQIKYKNEKKTIEEYETLIRKLKEENDKMTKKYNQHLGKNEDDNKQLLFDIDNKIKIYNRNRALMIKDKTRKAEILQEIENQRQIFKQRSEINKIKYDELQIKFENLTKKIMAMQLKIENKKKDKLNGKGNKKFDPDKEKLQEEINSYEDKNNKLIKQIEELNKKWKNISIENTTKNFSNFKSNFGRFDFKFGKKFVGNNSLLGGDTINEKNENEKSVSEKSEKTNKGNKGEIYEQKEVTIKKVEKKK